MPWRRKNSGTLNLLEARRQHEQWAHDHPRHARHAARATGATVLLILLVGALLLVWVLTN